MNSTTNQLDKVHASDLQLRILLYGDEYCSTTAEIAAHVESCEMCQTRLEDLSQFSVVEKEVNCLLNGYPSEEGLSYRSQFAKSLSEKRQRELKSEISLGPPSHPEMLGRLGRYEIERRIGSGGMGVVFKGIDTELHRPVAIKVLAPYLATNGAARQRFGRESRAAAAVVHEHVVAIHNVESDGETPFIVMQYVSGESLHARVSRKGPLSVEEILRIGIQTASGLAAAHEQGIVHRDVKPENILLEEGVERVLLTDFGLARTVDDASLTHTGVVAGTPNYMSPEQANGEDVDFRTDLFSLGSVLYFVATGHPPFRAERAMGVLHRICSTPHRPVWQVNSQIPIALSEVIDRLLEKNPNKRFGSASTVREGLTRILARIQSGKPSVGAHLHSWISRHSRLVCGASLAVIAFLVLSFAWSWSTSSVNNDVFLTAKQEGDADLNLDLTSDATERYSQDDALKRNNAFRETVALLNELTTAERMEYDKSIRQIHDQLHRMENRSIVPESSQDTGTWRQELMSIDQVLNHVGRK